MALSERSNFIGDIIINSSRKAQYIFNMKRLAIAVVAVCTFCFSSCEQRDKRGRVVDTPTTGKLTILADESLRPIVDAEVDVFNALYTRAHIDVIYLPEAEVVNTMMNSDTTRVAVMTRHLTQAEAEWFKKEVPVKPREEDVAISAIAVILNSANQDTLLSVEQLRDVLQGKSTTWNELGSSNQSGIEIVFDSPNSSLIRHLKDSIAKVDKLPANCFAANSNEAVVDYVAKNKNAMGLIGLEWISDKQDSTANSFLSRVQVAGIAGDSTHFQPYQAYIALKYYPLIRKISVINCQGRTGLGSGFASHFASERGQRIVLKAGLVPKTMPLRIVEYK